MEQAAQQEAVDACISRVMEMQGEYDQELAALQRQLQQKIAELGVQRAAAQQQVADLASQISVLQDQLGQLNAAEDQAAVDAATDHSSEDIELTPIMSRSQRRHRGRWLARSKAAAAAATQPPPHQLEELHAMQTQSSIQHLSQQQQQQQQQQSSLQQSQDSVRIGIRMLELPTQDQPFPVSFEREQDALQRHNLARQQAQLTAQLEMTELHSNDITPSSSEEEYAVYERVCKYGAATWLEDVGVLDSSDDIDVIPDSDCEY
jgi:hypothetical protein